ncbi:hypothetical protein FACS1894122_13790 [Alphaproteobacteria bacterium]|nr:hypothetical protein FACS1894122_13790 [Alphaproteobacteria bacterium]
MEKIVIAAFAIFMLIIESGATIQDVNTTESELRSLQIVHSDFLQKPFRIFKFSGALDLEYPRKRIVGKDSPYPSGYIDQHIQEIRNKKDIAVASMPDGPIQH